MKDARTKAKHVISVLVPNDDAREELSGLKLEIVEALEGLLELLPESPAPDPVNPVVPVPDPRERHLPANVLEALDRIGG